jgi:hypothetical protein
LFFLSVCLCDALSFFFPPADTGYGREIDGADLVLRLKHAMTRGHEADVGARTDVRFVYMPPLPWVKMEDASKGPVTYALTTARGFKWYMVRVCGGGTFQSDTVRIAGTRPCGLCD